jgi:hypothetical protein
MTTTVTADSAARVPSTKAAQPPIQKALRLIG